MEEYDVAVIGAGPAGSMAAKYAAENGASTLLLEEHSRVGWPVQCAGLLGIRAVEESELGPDWKLESFAIRSVRGATVYSPGGCRLSFRAQEERAWVVDRRLFDRALLSQAVGAGADFRIGSPVAGLVREGKKSLLTVGRGDDEWQVETKVVISAEGVKAKLARSARIGPPQEVLSGAQVEVPFQMDDEEKVELFLGDRVAPGFFAWAIPTQEGTARIGLCCQGNAYQYLQQLLNDKPIRDRLEGGPVNLVVGGLPLGPPPFTVAEGMMAVGDAAGQVKPTSGGGVYPGLVCAKIAGQVAASAALEGDSSPTRLQEYERRWRSAIGKELSLGMRVHKMVNQMTDMERDQIVKHLAEKESLIKIIEDHGDIDRPSKAIKMIAPRLGLSDLKMGRMLWRLYRETSY